MNVAEAAGAALAALGVRRVFGVVGSGNFRLVNALVAGGAEFTATRHEAGAAVMADAYARVSGQVGVVSVHQGPGLTNALTGITEAAKSRTPLLVLAAETAAAAVRSNFRIDQPALATAVGAIPERIHSADSAAADLARAWHTAAEQRRTVVLNLPLDVQAAEVAGPLRLPAPAVTSSPAPAADAVKVLADELAMARRPVFIAGRGAMLCGAGAALRWLAESTGALLATSAVSRGLFRGDPYDLDVSGGFATPLVAELIGGADLIIGWGCGLNMWTLRHGTLVGPDAVLAQVDDDPAALGAHRSVDIAVTGDAAVTADVVAAELDRRGHTVTGYRTPEIAQRLTREGRWRDVPYKDLSTDGQIDPRTLSVRLDDLLPAERQVAVDSGNFMGYPAMYLSVPDAGALVFTQAFQSIGLGLATATGAALARPDRLTVAALGDGGALMGIAELETVARLGLGMLIVVYDDEAYGAEVHHFGPGGHALDTVRFPPTDLAAIARGFGCTATTVRGPDDLRPVRDWLAGPRDRPLLLDAKVTADEPAWWLEEAFRGH
ncbi:thiamine pyrophosphate-binding protein [Streptomyces boninensis]|uniref:thiamine pyrophosphate-binding protein n=1 Tax=Streptomyces boninensis TaxID=2039455 RepID=UPI003B21891B